jgi:hypothetical protein
MNIIKINTREYINEALRQGNDALAENNKIRVERGYKTLEPNSDTSYNSVYSSAYMDYTKANINEELNNILNMQDYKKIEYNNINVEFIISQLGLKDLSHNEKKILDWVVYEGKQRARAEREQQAESEREAEAKTKGYTKTPYWDSETPINDFEKIKEAQKQLDHKKVIGLFCLTKNGLMGSYDKWEEKEGTLIYSENYKTLMLMPKRHTRTGYILKTHAYIKVIE